MLGRPGVGALLLLLLLSLAAVVPSAAARLPRCEPGCQDCYLDACAAHQDCVTNAQCEFKRCLANPHRVSAIAGRCALTHDQVGSCRVDRARLQSGCDVMRARVIREACECRITRRAAHVACNVCDAVITTTTTTTVSGTTSTTLAGATLTLTSTTTRSIAPLASRRARALDAGDVCDPEDIDLPFFEVGNDDDPGRCQRTCIEGIVGDCYRDCRDACEGDRLALRFCRRGCRDASCAVLEARCTTSADATDDGGSFTHYQVCCQQPDRECLEDVDCKVTTTITTSTTTTNSTTSTTVIGATTTTTTLF